ncbi:unnamed protein product, partial [Meganyctiphanes norvegica]
QSLKMWLWITLLSLVVGWASARSALIPGSKPTPLVDPGLFVIQGVTSCENGTGYCMLGHNCEVDVDFLPTDTNGHCDGLREAFTPRIHFDCCRFNPNGSELTTQPPTTTIASYTITDIFNLIDEQVLQDQASQDYEGELPEDFNPEDIIDIVGVIGLVTRPWTGTLPTRSTTTPIPPTSKATTTMKTTTVGIPPATPADTSSSEEKPSNEDVTDETIEPTEDYNKAPPTEPETELTTQHQPEKQTTPQVQETSLEPQTEQSVQMTESPQQITQLPQTTQAEQQKTQDQHLSDKPQLLLTTEETLLQTSPVTTNPIGSEGTSLVNLVFPGHTESSITNEINNHFNIDVFDIRDDSPFVEETIVQNEMSPDYFDYNDQLQLQAVNQDICGIKGYENPLGENSLSRIIGGVVATTVEWCWVAAIMEKRSSGDKYVCTGAIVESNLIITTGTCLRRLSSQNIGSYRVVLGDSNLLEDQPYGVQFHDIEEIVRHPDYFTSGGAHANDIGLIRIRTHATLGNNVCLICMAQQDAVFPTQTCTVAGYGIGKVPSNVLREVRKEAPKEGVLRQLSVPLMEKSECHDSLKNITGSEVLAMKDTFICAGGLHNYSACYSTLDGGSPLACKAGGRWFLAGLVSWSRDCSKPGVPNIYTRTSTFTDWVQSTYLNMLGFMNYQVRLL